MQAAAEHVDRLVGNVGDDGVEVGLPDKLARDVDDFAEAPLAEPHHGLRLFLNLEDRFDVLRHQLHLGELREVVEDLHVLHARHARLPVDDAKCAHDAAVRRSQRFAGIKADVRLSRDEGIVGEAPVGLCVRHDQRLPVVDGMGAEGRIARVLLDFETVMGKVVLPVAVDQRDHGHRHVEQPRRQPGDAVKPLVRRRIEQPQTVQRGQSLAFVGGRAGGRHTT
jgi:hypothetical protein